MAIAIISKSVETDVNSNTLLISHTVAAGSDRALLGLCVMRGSDTNDACKWDGSSGTDMTLIGTGSSGTGTTDRKAYLWGLLDPTVQTVDVHFGFSATTLGVCAVMNLTGVSGFGTEQNNGQTSVTSSSITPAANATDLIIDVIGPRTSDVTITMDGDQTEEFNAAHASFGNLRILASSQLGSFDDVMSWSWATAGQLAHVGAAMVDVDGGAGPVITDVNTTEAWDDGDAGLVITGTGFV